MGTLVSRSPLAWLERLVATGLLAILTTLASVKVERRGPELVEAGNLCGPNMDQLCMVPALSGGFPFGYLVDSPNVSVPDKLGFGEDHFDGARFGLDVVVHWLVLFVLLLLVRGLMQRASDAP